MSVSPRRSFGTSPDSIALSSSTSVSSKSLRHLLHRDTVNRAFANECGGGANQFSTYSTIDVFEIFPLQGGILRQGLDDSELRSWLDNDVEAASMRLLFLDGIPDQPDILPITESLLHAVFEKLDVSPRFMDNLSRQHMPGREIRRLSRDEFRYQIWYTAVLRSDGDSFQTQFKSANQTLEFTRQYAYWQRFLMWADYRHQNHGTGPAGGTTTYMIWRCPRKAKQAFLSTFIGESGLRLLDHPMAVHAFFTEKIVLHTHDFLAYFSNPLYQWENRASELRTPDDYTERSRAFLALARQIHQISTDYDILAASIEYLRVQATWLGAALRDQSTIDGSTNSIQHDFEDTFENLEKEVKLIGVYTKLYLERSKIGVDECFAMTNQRDSELNIQIAQASHQDNRSLRIIQVLTVIFLPGSLISSIFGMGFFSTSLLDNGTAVFTVSRHIWVYFVLSVPLTAVIMAVMLYYQWRDKTKAEDQWSRRRSLADPEALGLKTRV
ncbi:hypothetical protein F5Y15DRAFT_427552 [Xylariaceae sp. FL0016]|nr:hypothetical protein F5Y15DRAFT_427552 [Xylariaceae sp. FL0016]